MPVARLYINQRVTLTAHYLLTEAVDTADPPETSVSVSVMTGVGGDHR